MPERPVQLTQSQIYRYKVRARQEFIKRATSEFWRLHQALGAVGYILKYIQPVPQIRRQTANGSGYIAPAVLSLRDPLKNGRLMWGGGGVYLKNVREDAIPEDQQYELRAKRSGLADVYLKGVPEALVPPEKVAARMGELFDINQGNFNYFERIKFRNETAIDPSEWHKNNADIYFQPMDVSLDDPKETEPLNEALMDPEKYAALKHKPMFHLLIDDVYPENLARLKADGFQPAAVIRTSNKPGRGDNCQVYLNVPFIQGFTVMENYRMALTLFQDLNKGVTDKEAIEKGKENVYRDLLTGDARERGKAAGADGAMGYGDPNITSMRHVSRLPCFYNSKLNHIFNCYDSNAFISMASEKDAVKSTQAVNNEKDVELMIDVDGKGNYASIGYPMFRRSAEIVEAADHQLICEKCTQLMRELGEGAMRGEIALSEPTKHGMGISKAYTKTRSAHVLAKDDQNKTLQWDTPGKAGTSLYTAMCHLEQYSLSDIIKVLHKEFGEDDITLDLKALVPEYDFQEKLESNIKKLGREEDRYCPRYPAEMPKGAFETGWRLNRDKDLRNTYLRLTALQIKKEMSDPSESKSINRSDIDYAVAQKMYILGYSNTEIAATMVKYGTKMRSDSTQDRHTGIIRAMYYWNKATEPLKEGSIDQIKEQLSGAHMGANGYLGGLRYIVSLSQAAHFDRVIQNAFGRNAFDVESSCSNGDEKYIKDVTALVKKSEDIPFLQPFIREGKLPTAQSRLTGHTPPGGNTSHRHGSLHY